MCCTMYCYLLQRFSGLTSFDTKLEGPSLSVTGLSRQRPGFDSRLPPCGIGDFQGVAQTGFSTGTRVFPRQRHCTLLMQSSSTVAM